MLIREASIQRLLRAVNKKKSGVTVKDLKILATATGNTKALAKLESAGIAELAGFKTKLAQMFPANKPAPAKSGEAAFFGMSGKDTVVAEGGNKMYDYGKSEDTADNEEQRSLRGRRKMEKWYEAKKDIKTVADALAVSIDPAFKTVLNRGYKQASVSKKGRYIGVSKKTALYPEDSGEEDTETVTPDNKKVDTEMQKCQATKCINYDEGRKSGCKLKVIDILEKGVCKQFKTEPEGDSEVPANSESELGNEINDPEPAMAGKERGVPDGTGPYGRGAGPGKGKADGTGLKNKENKEKSESKKYCFKKISEVQPGQQVGIKDPTTGEITQVTVDQQAQSVDNGTGYIGTDESGNQVIIPEGTEVMTEQAISSKTPEKTASTLLNRIRELVGQPSYASQE